MRLNYFPKVYDYDVAGDEIVGIAKLALTFLENVLTHGFGTLGLAAAKRRSFQCY